MQTQRICFDKESNKCVKISIQVTKTSLFPRHQSFKAISEASELIITIKQKILKDIPANFKNKNKEVILHGYSDNPVAHKKPFFLIFLNIK